jgi:Cysteine-rich secretory protein family
VRQPGSCRTTRTNAPTHALIVGILSLTLVAFSAVPAAAAGGLWRAREAEDVAVRLTNCIRSGGLVTRAGTCRGWGKGNHSRVVPKLKRSDRISNRVSWPWAQKSVRFQGTRSCWIGHDRNGSTVDRRFASVSLRHIANGENMGCGMYGSGKETVVRIVRLWQTEKSWNGPHWRQIKDPEFKSIGVGVARYGKIKTQIVINFYGKSVD